jgi:mono/diheme cytochrome c family protein
LRTIIRILILTGVFLLLGVGSASAHNFRAALDDISMGAQLYDKWFTVLGVPAPNGNMPIWERQTTNTRSGPDTWRCSECHGWDYKGSEGIYGTGSHATGFPNVMKLASGMSESDIVDHLKGSKDPSHDFSKYLSDSDMGKLAKFLKEGTQDFSSVINPITLKAIGGNLENGKKLFETNCLKCHGTDGKLIVFRSEGVNEYLGSVANRDPYRFMHRTRYGVSGAKDMPLGRELGWTSVDSTDVLAYTQSLPTGFENVPVTNAGAGSEKSPNLGGPQGGVLGGILAGLLAISSMLGMSAFFLLGLVILGVLIVWALRKRK